MEFNSIYNITKKLQLDNLPGDDAHFEIAPYRKDSFPKGNVESKHAAVLILLYPKLEKTFFTLIKRPIYDGSHSGQIAFPGGKVEPSDKNIIHTALREAWEETNIEEEKVDVIGELSKIYIPPSNFFVTPILGISSETPNYKADEREVDQILEIEFSHLFQKERLKEREMILKSGLKFNTPYFDLADEIVWGATAMILNELKLLYQNESDL